MATEDELKLHQQQDGSVVVGDPPPTVEDPPPEEDAALGAAGQDDDDDAPLREEAAPDTETAEEREARTERNRRMRQESKTRRKEYVERLKRELAARDSIINEMNQRLAVVERKSSGSEMAQLETAEREAMNIYNHFKATNQQAIEQANGAAATDAQEKMFAAAQRIQQIQNIKRAMGQRQQQAAPLDPRLINHAQEWMERHSWYDPSGGDDDSAMVLSIDHQLAKQGWDPTTPQYWDELSKRVQKYIPHKGEKGYNRGAGSARSPHVPVAGSGRESGGGASSNSRYVLSPERVQAMKDAGMWDDPKSRADMIARYQQMDKEQRA